MFVIAWPISAIHNLHVFFSFCCQQRVLLFKLDVQWFVLPANNEAVKNSYSLMANSKDEYLWWEDISLFYAPYYVAYLLKSFFICE